MKRIILSTSLLLIALSSFAQGSLEGIITDVDTGEPVPGYSIYIDKNDILIQKCYSDIQGYFKVSALDPGNYSIYMQMPGGSSLEIHEIIIRNNQQTIVNPEINFHHYLCNYAIVEYSPPLLESEPYVSGQTFTAEDIYRRRGAE